MLIPSGTKEIWFPNSFLHPFSREINFLIGYIFPNRFLKWINPDNFKEEEEEVD